MSAPVPNQRQRCERIAELVDLYPTSKGRGEVYLAVSELLIAYGFGIGIEAVKNMASVGRKSLCSSSDPKVHDKSNPSTVESGGGQ